MRQIPFPADGRATVTATILNIRRTQAHNTLYFQEVPYRIEMQVQVRSKSGS
jgi:hypothetical protein